MERGVQVDLGCIIHRHVLVLMVQPDCAKSAGRCSARRAVRVWSEKYDFGGRAGDERTAPGDQGGVVWAKESVECTGHSTDST
jgi:hypothetical protein